MKGLIVLISFNLQCINEQWIGHVGVGKLASIKNICVRARGMCNPSGIKTPAGLEPLEIEWNYLAGHRCGNE